jgi:hypothetical protein
MVRRTAVLLLFNSRQADVLARVAGYPADCKNEVAD